jgi:hypothetical protein
MKNVCGELYANVLRDNERLDFMEQFMIRKPRRRNQSNNKKHRFIKRGIAPKTE